MNAKAIVLLGAFLMGAAWWVYQSRAEANARAAATHQLASVLCDSGTLAKVVDAYPQSHMSREELGAQTLGEGVQRVNHFRSALPALVDPLVPDLRSDRTAWAYIAGLAKDLKSPQLLSDKKRRRKVEDFTNGVAATMKSACPTQFQSAATEKYATFGIGAILGDLGRQPD